MSQDFENALRSEIEELLRDPGDGGHFHFDIPELKFLVPTFKDPQWVTFAQQIAQILVQFENSLLLAVPLLAVNEIPELFDVEELELLDPWEPPGIYAPAIGSVRHLRLQSKWYSDDVPSVEGAQGWVSATQVPSDTLKYGLTLRYENGGSS